MIVIGGSRGSRLGLVDHAVGPRDRDAAAVSRDMANEFDLYRQSPQYEL
jgi:hypothetical protein